MIKGALAISFFLISLTVGLNRPDTINKMDKWPAPIYPLDSITEDGFQLGRKLFYDPNLSRDGSISCANCHLQFTGFTHVDHNVSHGIDGKKGTRNSPALINLAWNEYFHWDGGVNHLNVQGLNPIQHPAEMDNSLENLLSYVSGSSDYKSHFFKAFGDSVPSIPKIMKALSFFAASLVSNNSKFDKFQRNEVDLTDQEKNGYNLFNTHCASCHLPPLFMTNSFKSNGLAIDSNFNDVGRFAITHKNDDSLHFKVPTLRNIQYTFPYMHDGRYRKLMDVIDHYCSIDTEATHLSEELKNKIELNDNQRKDLLAFLHTLTDKEFLFNEKFSFPK